MKISQPLHLSLLLLPLALLQGQPMSQPHAVAKIGAEVQKAVNDICLSTKNQESSVAMPERNSALAALEMARKQSGKPIVKLVKMVGKNGAPDPRGWSMTFHDPASSTYLSELSPGDGPEPSAEKYGKGESPNYFAASRVSVDSHRAFDKANKEAAAAKIGFDRIDYELRGREFSGEPIWTLRLINADDDLVGTVHLSAESGKILRTVWLRRTADGDIRVIDSALSSGGPSAAADSSEASEAEDLRALPPVQNIEPPPAPKPE
jgi:uncharacterized membrane protein YkoI